MLKGIDVSHWDGEIDWNRVAEAGISFAFIKATEGTTFFDSTWKRNIRGAFRAGLLAGSYHYLKDTGNGREQAKWFLSKVGSLVGQLRPVLDIEERKRSSVAEYSATALAWLNEVADAIGTAPIVYASLNYARNHLRGLWQFPLWLAYWRSPDLLPRGPFGEWSTWVFWQYTDRGRVPGVPTACDLNLFRGSYDDLYRDFVVGANEPRYTPGPVRVVLLPENKVIDCHAEYDGAKVRCDLRPLAEALGAEVADHIPDQRKVYLSR